MVLHHVTDGSDLIVKAAASLDAEALGHRDLYAFDMLAIPKRLQKRICEPEEKHVVDRRFAEIVIDTEDRLLVKRIQQDLIQSLSGGEIAPKRLFNDHSCVLSAIGLGKLLDD